MPVRQSFKNLLTGTNVFHDAFNIHFQKTGIYCVVERNGLSELKAMIYVSALVVMRI